MRRGRESQLWLHYVTPGLPRPFLLVDDLTPESPGGLRAREKVSSDVAARLLLSFSSVHPSLPVLDPFPFFYCSCRSVLRLEGKWREVEGDDLQKLDHLCPPFSEAYVPFRVTASTSPHAHQMLEQRSRETHR